MLDNQTCTKIGVLTPPPERRRHIRQLALLRVGLLHAGGESDICVVRNVSPNGLSARVYRKLVVGEEVEIEFRSGQSLAGSVVWESECDVGIVFPQPVDVASVLANRAPCAANKRRSLPRINVECEGQINTGLRSIEVILRDISQGGAHLEAQSQPARMSNVHLQLPDLPPVPGVVRWATGTSLGISFNECIAFEQLARWIQVRREAPRLVGP